MLALSKSSRSIPLKVNVEPDSPAKRPNVEVWNKSTQTEGTVSSHKDKMKERENLEMERLRSSQTNLEASLDQLEREKKDFNRKMREYTE